MPALAAAATSLMLSLLLPPLTLLSGAVIVLVTLEKGVREGVNTTVAAALAAGLLGAIVFGNFVLPALYGLATWSPPLMAAILFRLGGASLTLALEGLALLTALLVASVYLVVEDPAAVWQQLLMAQGERLSGQIAIDPAQLEPLIAKLSRVMVGLLGAAVVFHFTLTFLLGLALEGWFRRRSLQLLFARLKPHRLLALATLLLGGLGFAGSPLAVNLALPLLALFFTVGLISLHLVLRAKRRLWLWLFYFALLFVPHLAVPVTVVGLLDPWIDLKSRISGST